MDPWVLGEAIEARLRVGNQGDGERKGDLGWGKSEKALSIPLGLSC